MARDLAADWSGSREGEGKREGAIKEASDSVSLETVRDTLELALEEELRDDEEDVEVPNRKYVQLVLPAMQP